MDERRKTILLLGGSQAQVVAIRKAHELGYRTVLCDYLPDNPGRFEADKFYQVSTTDREAVLEVARRERVDGVLAYGSDPASPAAAYVADVLGLPGNPLEAVEVMGDKGRFRDHLRKAGLPCPQAVTFAADTTADDALGLIGGFSWPVVVKPTDSSGSRGVTVVEDPAGLARALVSAREFSRNGTLIAEEYIGAAFPHVIGGDIFVVDGEVRFWGLMSCLRDASCSLVPCGKFAPTGLSERQLERTKAALQGLVTSLGLEFGELNVEVIVGRDDIPYIIELASRAGGNMIPVQLSDMSGADLIAANIRCAMGEEPGNLSFDTRDAQPCLTYVLHTNRAGTFERVVLSDEANGALYRNCLYVQRGDAVETFDGGASKALGILFLRFHDYGELESFIQEPGVNVLVDE